MCVSRLHQSLWLLDHSHGLIMTTLQRNQHRPLNQHLHVLLQFQSRLDPTPTRCRSLPLSRQKGPVLKPVNITPVTLMNQVLPGARRSHMRNSHSQRKHGSLHLRTLQDVVALTVLVKTDFHPHSYWAQAVPVHNHWIIIKQCASCNRRLLSCASTVLTACPAWKRREEKRREGVMWGG